MNRKQEIFQAVLTNPYNNDNFVAFVRELLNNVEMVAPNRYVEVRSNFSFYVNGYYHIGNYTSDDGDKIAIFAVCLNRGDTVERARGIQRNFVKPLLEHGGCSGALVAFYTKDMPEKWRLSFIRMDYEFSQGKVTEKLTPAKRYSYLVGKGEPCHTAQTRLYPIFSNDITNPGIDDLEEAFGVEKVTKEFFDLYSEKYHQLREYLEGCEEFQIESEYRKFSSEQFAKKLMGQIVFLYFIQKKGWLGVEAIPVVLSEKAYKNAFFARGTKSREVMPKVYKEQPDGSYRIVYTELKALSDEDEEFLAGILKGKPWGSGPKDFMRRIFDGCKAAGKNYFDDYLEPLFYTGLNKNRGENGFYAPLHRRIPFLNGGLFEQLDNYEWEHNNFAIPNELFSNVDEKGRDADGILDIFDRYNFTMNEDEPMEREVAIDPEMLGKVFENLLEISDRKEKGAFYTPREIVHYMCQETLINYLVTKTGLPEQDIQDFILYGDLMRDEDTTKSAREGNQDMLISTNILDPQNGVNRLKELDDLLATVKVADLAVGSGAFPLGMLNEIVKAREVLSAYMSIGMNAFQKKSFYAYDRKPYDLKVNTIKNCIYACDIEPSAVDIAKLRLWLSIVIDDEITEEAGNGEFDAHARPRQLPNLDCNIICGNSLIDEFKGNKLISESELLHNVSQNSQQTLFQSGVDSLLNELIHLQDRLFFVKEHDEKEEIKQSIQKIYDAIILEQIQGNPDLIEEYYEAVSGPSQPFIIWQLYFPKVFRDNGGFDVVIGNPPYVQLQKTINEETGAKLGDSYANKGFQTFVKTGDIYCLFYEQGYNLLRKDGVLSFITSNKWMRAGYGEKLRGFFAKHTNPTVLIDFAGQKIFESATVDVNILTFTKNENKGQTRACIVKENCTDNLSVYVNRKGRIVVFDNADGWVILSATELSIKHKIEAVGIPLKDWDIAINYGVKTGYNDAFIISSSVKEQLIQQDPKSAELIRPILRGRDIKRYSFVNSNLYLLYIPWHFPLVDDEGIVGALETAENCFKTQYPAVYNHLLHHKEALSKRNQAETGIRYEWYALQRYGAKYMDDFNKQKIMYNDINQRLSFCLVPEGFYCNNTVYFIADTPYNKYLLAFLNSKLIDWYYKNLSVQLGEKAVRMFSIYVENIPIPKLESDMFSQFEQLVERLLKAQSDKERLEISDKIDDLVFKTYKLTNTEISFIENIYT